MRLCKHEVRFRKRISLWNVFVPSNTVIKCLGVGGGPVALLFFLLLFGTVVNGEVTVGSSSASSSIVISNVLISCSNLGVLLVIYSVLPHFANAKSIRHGKEKDESDNVLLFNATLSSISPATVNQSNVDSTTTSNNSTLFSSRTLLTSSDEESMSSTTLTPSEEMEISLDNSSEEERRKKREREAGIHRLKRQMGLAAEIALIAPALQTMGCIPKFFCGLNSRPPTQESSALNDLAYLIKFAMLDDDETDFDDALFDKNVRGKDGLTKIKEDLVFENLAEEELIQEDPANLPFVWQDMEHRIKSKTKPGNKVRIEDVMDEIIIQPEQTAVGSLFTGIKSVLRIGRSVDHVLNRDQTNVNESSQATPRSGRSRIGDSDEKDQLTRKKRLRWSQRWKKQPFWRTPQFRQDMELAQRIGKTEQDEGKCSTTFNVCPYTVHEMMDIVHGGYKKKQEKEERRKKRPQWFLNADGPPKESSEEDLSKKQFKDPENLLTTTTEKTKWYPNDPENQLYYAMFPHKAVEIGLTTVRTTRKPPSDVDNDDDDNPETVYDIGPRPPMREHRRPPLSIQGHVEYENDEGSFEGKKPEHMDVAINNKKPVTQPPRKQSWWNLGGGGNRRPPPPQQHHRPHGPPPPGMGRPHQQNHNQNRPTGFNAGISQDDNNKSGNNEEDSSEEEVKRKRKNNNNKVVSSSDSIEDEEENGSSEEKNSRYKNRPASVKNPPTQSPSSPEASSIKFQLPPELQSADPNTYILSIQPIQNGGDLVPTGVPQQDQSPQQIQPFFQDTKLKQTPIALPRPKYRIQKEKKQNKRIRPQVGMHEAQKHQTQQQTQAETPNTHKPKNSKKEDKSNETSGEEEEDDESQENNSSEEKATNDENVPSSPIAPLPPQHRPTVNVILHGRPSEELRDVPKQHIQARPHPGMPESSASAEDDLDNSDEENRNSNSAAAELSSNEMSLEMAKIPQPARPQPHPDENNGHPPSSLYSYFNKRPRDENNKPPHPPQQQQQGQQHPPPPPQSTTQKYSTGLLSFIFGKDKKQQRPAGSIEMHHQQQQNQQYSPNISEEEANDDDDDDGDLDSSEERDIPSKPKPTFTGPDGKYETGHLANNRPPNSLTPNFKPPQRPQRPYRGSTSMEDSDEKRGRSTPAPPTTQYTTTELPKPLIFIGNPHKTFIPPPATPPKFVHLSTDTELVSTKASTKKDSDEEDEPESEEKTSDESKEDEEDNSSEEKAVKKKPTKKSNKPGTAVPLPPISNYHSGKTTVTTSTTTRPKSSKPSTKKRTDYGNDSDEKQADDSNQTKEDESAEEKKLSKEVRSEEESDEEGNSSEEQNKKHRAPPPPRRKPEDDELDHPSAQFPPQVSVGGDIAAVEEILGAQDGENTDDEDVPYGGSQDIPVPPPLALKGFAPSLEIVVPTKSPLHPPPGVPLQQFYQGNNPLSGGPPSGPGPHAQPPHGLGQVNPTSVLGLAQQAGSNNNGLGGQGGSEQSQQGIRNPLGQTSNRRPGNRPPSQQGQRGQQNNRRPQQGNQNQGGKEDSSEENSSEEKDGESSEEKGNKGNDDGVDEAILSLGEKDNDDEDDDNDKPEEDIVKQPPAPPPVFTGSAEQKQELQKLKPFLPRPITPQPTIYLRPKPGRREPILKNQLKPTEILHLHHPQKIYPPPMKKPAPHQLHQPPSHQQQQFVLPMRPSAAANLRPLHQLPQPSSHSFAVSHLLRPLMPRPILSRKPLDPKVVQWIKESYGIPDLNGNHDPNRSGLQSEDDGASDKTAKASSNSKLKKSENVKGNKMKTSSSKRKTSKPETSKGSAEKRHSAEVTTSTTSKTTTTTTPTTTTTTTAKTTTPTTTAGTTTTASTKAPTTSSMPPVTTIFTTAAAKKENIKKATLSSTLTKKSPPDYITEEQEAKMAQALFGSSEEEPEEEEKDSDEEDDDHVVTEKYKSKVKTKVGSTKLVITVQSVMNNNNKKTLPSSRESSKSKSAEVGKLPGGKASERKKPFNLSSSREKQKNSSRETTKFSSGEKSKQDKKKIVSKSGSSEQHQTKKNSSLAEVNRNKFKHTTINKSSLPESAKRISTTTLNPKYALGTRSTPRPKPIKLPPIYGKLPRRSG